jgi:hypothetical protein
MSIYLASGEIIIYAFLQIFHFPRILKTKANKPYIFLNLILAITFIISYLVLIIKLFRKIKENVDEVNCKNKNINKYYY